MKKMQKMIAVLFSVAMCAAMAVPAFAAETDTARNEEQETVMPRAIVYEEINIPGDGKFYKITDDFEMPAKSRVSFQGTWSPAYARLEFRLYAHSTGNGAYVMLTSGREGGLDATAASVYSLYARSVDNVKVTGAVNITNWQKHIAYKSVNYWQVVLSSYSCSRKLPPHSLNGAGVFLRLKDSATL